MELCKKGGLDKIDYFVLKLGEESNMWQRRRRKQEDLLNDADCYPLVKEKKCKTKTSPSQSSTKKLKP